MEIKHVKINYSKSNIMIIYLIIVLAIITRFIPHMSNFSPITALAIFAGANLGWKKSVGLTLAVRFISDYFLGFFAWPLMLAVYAAHLVGVLFGVWIKNKKPNHPASLREAPLLGRRGSSAVVLGSSAELQSSPPNIGGVPSPWRGGGGMSRWLKVIFSPIAASIIFFLVTNFAFLYADYQHNISGILLAYANGLPFLRGTLFGDLSYTIGLFGIYELAKRFKISDLRFKLSPVKIKI